MLTNDTEHESQLTRLRRSVIAEDESEECYEQFFVGGQPPTGFESSKKTKYICQAYETFECFSTMFDLGYGIAIYAGYLVTKDQAANLGAASRAGIKFRQEPGKHICKASVVEAA